MLDYEHIEKILYNTAGTTGILAILAPQERDRLSDLLYNALNEFEGLNSTSSKSDPKIWTEAAKRLLVGQLKESEEFFGIKDLSEKLSLDEFLEQFYKADVGSAS